MRKLMVAGLVAGFLTGTSVIAQDDQQKVDEVFAAYNKPDSPGCALGVIRDGSFVYRKGFGMGSLELGVPLSSASVFYMGSVSKQFTAASVVLAAEQGYVALDDDVRKYIPELPDYGHPITLREMLHHTSGLRDFLTLLAFADRDGGDIHSQDELIDLIARQKGLNNVPGERFIYSNSNYFLLGVVIKRATGKSLEEFAHANIFASLDMTHTRFYDDHTMVLPGRVAAYEGGNDGNFLVDWSTGYDIVGAGGLTSSVDDLLRWDQNFYTNKLGKGMLLKELQTRGVLNNGKEISYALGLEMNTYRGLPIVDHNGGLYGYRTEILRFPGQRFSVVCLCNVSSANTTALVRKVADIYLKDELKEEGKGTNAPRFPDATPYAGEYLDAKNHFVYTFAVSGNTLKAWGADLRRVGPNTFKDLGTGTITFTLAGGRMHATLAMDGEDFFAGDRIEMAPLSANELTAYVGKYRSPEVDATYDLEVKDGGLQLKFKRDPAVKLEVVGRDEFENGDLGDIVMVRDGTGRVSGFTVYSINARGVEFVRVD